MTASSRPPNGAPIIHHGNDRLLVNMNITSGVQNHITKASNLENGAFDYKDYFID
jgi:hypothetical protein